MRRLLPLVAVALTLAACTGDAPFTGPSTSSGPTSPSPSTAPSATALTATCELDASGDAPTIVLRHPDAWPAVTGGPDCGWFDPAGVSVAPGTENIGVDVRFDVEDVTFADAAAPSPSLDEQQRDLATVDGRQAVRIVGTSTGEGLLPVGVATTTWLVDLDLGTDETGGVLVGTTADVDGVDYDRARSVLDAIARTADFDGQEPRTVVARTEGGGAPWLVTTADGCFALRAPDDEVLDETCTLAGPSELSVDVLTSDATGDVLVGTTAPSVDLVEPVGDLPGVVTVPLGPHDLDARRAFALSLPNGGWEVAGRTFGGAEVARATPDTVS